MPFGRPPISNTPLNAVYRREKQLKPDGCNNGGVWIARVRKTNEKCVEKSIKPKDVVNGKAHLEISMLRTLSHRNITRYIDAFITSPPNAPMCSLYMGACEFGSLSNALEQHAQRRLPMPEELVWQIFMQLVNALGYIQYGIEETVVKVDHSFALNPGWRGIVHRDIHPGNIFLATRKTPNSAWPRVLLGDFGCAVYANGTGIETSNFTYQNPNWAPVEAPAFGFPTDVWCLGVVMQSICRLDQDPEVYGHEIKHGRRYRGAGSHYTPQLNAALHLVMKENWVGRPTVLNLIQRLMTLEGLAKYPREGFPEWAFNLQYW